LNKRITKKEEGRSEREGCVAYVWKTERKREQKEKMGFCKNDLTVIDFDPRWRFKDRALLLPHFACSELNF
jgi:hypothetical protein